MSKRAGHCIFCKNTNLTKEHIWPRWLQSHLPMPAGRARHVANLRQRNLHGAVLHSPERRTERPGHPMTHKLRCVCRTCNNNWMGKLQEMAKPVLLPLIRGEWKRLNRRERKILAAWAVMFSMVFEFKDVRTVAVPFYQRDEFRQTLIPPKGWQVFIGTYDGAEWMGKIHHKGALCADRHRLAFAPERFDPTSSCNTQTTAFAVGRLFILAASTTDPIFPINYMKIGRRRLRRLWPPTWLSISKPNASIDDTEADFLANALELLLK